jgi:uncharacterized OB-fold protein
MVRPPALSDPPAASPSESAGQTARAPAPEERCAACGAALAADQEWCLDCGAARTEIHAPPDWRIGAAIVLAVIAVVVLVVIIVWP